MPRVAHVLMVLFCLAVVANCTSPTTEDGGTGGGGGTGPFTPNDPLFARQWHLHNTGQSGAGAGPALAGEDLNVRTAWGSVRGAGVRIAIVDDGLDVTHPDLAANVVADQSHDYMGGGTVPTPELSPHGTSCAGLAAAVGNNNLGVTGVAMSANLVGYNLLQALTDANTADAMNRGLAANHIYSNSWGATDGVGALTSAEATWRAAVDNGVTTGRGGRGAIYTWAAGNGAPVDRSDYDGQGSYHAVFAVAALNDQGKKASYSEPGANLLVSAYGGEFCEAQQTTSTDIQGGAGYNDGGSPNDLAGEENYTRCFNGTSAATPEVSGVVALMLEANPALTWRQVRWALATTARRNDPTDADWATNGAGFPVNHQYGFGVVNATAATAAARAFDAGMGVDLVSPQRTATGSQTTAVAIPDDAPAGASSTISLDGTGLTGVESVDVTLTSDHAQFGELDIRLTSPTGTVSVLASPHACVQDEMQVACGALLAQGHRFGVARLLGERAEGTWTLTVVDAAVGATGSISSWTLTVHGY